MFLIRANDGDTNIYTASALQALEAFQSLRRANLNPSMVDLNGLPLDVAALMQQLGLRRRAEKSAA